MVVDNPIDIRLSIDPLTYVLLSAATFGVVTSNESLDYLPVRPLCQPLLAVSFFGNSYFPAFRPASPI